MLNIMVQVDFIVGKTNRFIFTSL